MKDNRFFTFKAKVNKVWKFPTKKQPSDRVKAD
nr:MAG TPA: hypothetical protein [Caudoviricetes sp.]